MINKKGMWFLTLFSLIIVLSVYYVTMPEELLLTNKTLNNNVNSEVISVTESSELASFRAGKESELVTAMQQLQEILTSTESSIEEKNNAFEKMKELNNNKGLEESLEHKIRNNYNFDSYVKIDGNDIQVIVSSDKHDNKLANDIMRIIQEEFDVKKYVSVKFQS